MTVCKLLLLVFCALENDSGWSQKPASPNKPEVLTNGFIDVMNSGQMNAAARFVKLYIGDPKGFKVPVSIYSGVSANYFQSTQNITAQRSNQPLYFNMIIPLCGIINISLDGLYFLKHKNYAYSQWGFSYQLGERVLTGYKTGLMTDPQTGKPVNFFSSIVSGGIYFQTGAWEKNKVNEMGYSWFSVRYIGSFAAKGNLKQIFPQIPVTGLYHGYSIGWGVEINNLLNVRLLFYKYLKEPEFENGLPIYQFSFNYSLKY